ncbi:alcohol dehydrogenase catalytic domain-containing protein [Catellatospora coxensis]
MSGNKTVVYQGPGHVSVEDLDYPKLELAEQHRKINHGVILKVVATNICGSDQHMVRGRTTAPEGQTLGHEITGEVVEVGPDVEFIKVGDLCSVPFNIACGRCRMCMEGHTGVCLNVNPARAARRTATWTWAAGSADRRSSCWCRTPTGTCSSSRTRTGPWTRSSTWPC